MAITGSDTFSLDTTEEADGVLVRLAGDLDVEAAPLLRQALRRLIDERGSQRFRLDLSGVTFIDSTGLSALLGVHRRACESGGDLTLVNPRPSALRVFDVAGFGGLFNITHDPDRR